MGGGVRRLALKYHVKVGDLPDFERKPGVWDPLIGVGWHRNGNKVDWHAIFEAAASAPDPMSIPATRLGSIGAQVRLAPAVALRSHGGV